MPEINLPDLSLRWSQGGDILKPSDAKIQQGWTAEIPPRQWFNWLDNRQDEAIAHIAQHGISVWSPVIEYQAGKSFVQGGDGIVYKAITTNTNVNPVGGAAGNWQSAFLTADQATQVASAAQSRAMTANNVYLSPLQLANAFTGQNQIANPNRVSQKLPGGLIIQSGSAVTNTSGQATIVFDIPFTSDNSYKISTAVQASTFETIGLNRTLATRLQFSINSSKNSVATPSVGFEWIAIGL